MAPQSPVVLVVDDDAATLELVADLLAMEGYTAQPAATGLGALTRLRDSPVDLILVDLLLPDMSGLEFCQQVRARQGSRVPIILFSAASGSCWKANSLLAGADDYLAKPFDLDQLIARVGSHLLATALPS
jgi:two-component system phosphate regulon response regulator PhoB